MRQSSKSTPKKTTIYDIAKHCKVSPSTVSRVLSGSDYPVSQDTRREIMKAAEDLHYIPNLIGKSLKMDRVNDIGVVIPNMSNYYSTLLRGIQDVAQRFDSQIILCNSFRDPKTEEKNVNLLLQKQVKGILIASIDDTGTIIQNILNKNVSVVAMEQEVKVDCSRAGFNFASGAEIATRHLIELGHSDIAFVSAPLLRPSRKKLLDGYKKAMAGHGIPVKDEFVYVETHEHDDDDQMYDFMLGKRAAEYLMSLRDRPTAVFCINDMAAIGLIRQLQVRGVRVPDDLSVIGFDNILFTEMITPSLTTIDQSTYDLGHLAADLLFKNILPQHPLPMSHVTIQLEPKLIVRESTQARSP